METETRIKALAKYLELDEDDITESKHDDTCLEVGHGKYPNEYLVLTDDEADVVWEERLDSYIDECLEIPDHLQSYFDEEAWKRDARMDGRGHSISSYDGCEYDVEIDGETLYIFRTN